MLSLTFSDEDPDHYKIVEPDLIYYYTDTGHLTEIDIPNLSKHASGKKVHGLELDLAPDHSDTVFEIDLPRPVHELVEEAKQRSVTKKGSKRTDDH